MAALKQLLLFASIVSGLLGLLNLGLLVFVQIVASEHLTYVGEFMWLKVLYIVVPALASVIAFRLRSLLPPIAESRGT